MLARIVARKARDELTVVDRREDGWWGVSNDTEYNHKFYSIEFIDLLMSFIVLSWIPKKPRAITNYYGEGFE